MRSKCIKFGRQVIDLCLQVLYLSSLRHDLLVLLLDLFSELLDALVVGTELVDDVMKNDPLEPLYIVKETRKTLVTQDVVHVLVHLAQLGLDPPSVAVTSEKSEEQACYLENPTDIS